jgi:DNA-binding GntR family transcriptional regulator
VPISLSALAQRFGGSRVHVRTLLRVAEAVGLIERSGEGGSRVLLRPRLVAAAETFFASAFLFLAHCALRAGEETGTNPTSGSAAPMSRPPRMTPELTQ